MRVPFASFLILVFAATGAWAQSPQPGGIVAPATNQAPAPSNSDASVVLPLPSGEEDAAPEADPATSPDAAPSTEAPVVTAPTQPPVRVVPATPDVAVPAAPPGQTAPVPVAPDAPPAAPAPEVDGAAPVGEAVAPTAEEEEKPKSFNSVRLRALDKVTARTATLDIPFGPVERFGTLEIIARSCWQSPSDEEPENAALLEVRELKPEEAPKRIFFGWMFSSSPGLSAMDHPVYDLTVVECTNQDLQKVE